MGFSPTPTLSLILGSGLDLTIYKQSGFELATLMLGLRSGTAIPFSLLPLPWIWVFSYFCLFFRGLFCLF